VPKHNDNNEEPNYLDDICVCVYVWVPERRPNLK
jgi:hypothetical protein